MSRFRRWAARRLTKLASIIDKVDALTDVSGLLIEQLGSSPGDSLYTRKEMIENVYLTQKWTIEKLCGSDSYEPVFELLMDDFRRGP